MIWLAAPDPKLDRRCFIVRDYKGQALTFVSFEEEPGRRSAAHLLTRDEARRIATNIAKLPEFLAALAGFEPIRTSRVFPRFV